MAHFAKVEDGIVTGVFVIANDEIVDENGVEQESLGIARCNELMGEATWVQTSYNKNFRKLYAGIGFSYDAVKDKFIAVQSYPSWVLDENDDWVAPIAEPEWTDSTGYVWDEDNLQWVSFERKVP